MNTQQNTTTNYSEGGTTSIQGLFLIHHMAALERLQNVLTSDMDEDKRYTAFNRQLIYLLSLVPDDERRNSIWLEIQRRALWIKENPMFNRDKDGRENGYFARMAIVTLLVKYLAQSMDIVHNDIVGAVGHDLGRMSVLDDQVIEGISIEEEGVVDD